MTENYSKPRRRSDPKVYTPHYLAGFEVVGFESDADRTPPEPILPFELTLTAHEPSTCTDHEGAVDATLDIVVDGVRFDGCEVTLVPDHSGALVTWGDGLDMWAADRTQRAIEAYVEGDDWREQHHFVDEIVGDVRGAVEAAAS